METFYCRKCNIQLTHDNAEPLYGVHKNLYTTPFLQICKSCVKKYKRKRKIDVIIAHKIQGCCKCGYNKNLAALDFHHTKEKTYVISNLIWKQNSIKKLQEELDKCIVLCSNCHRELHHSLMDISNFV